MGLDTMPLLQRRVMPELPEVETVLRGLSRKILHKRIQRVEVLHAKTARGQVQRLQRTLKGRHVKKISRRGKLLVFHLHPAGGNGFLVVHLKMTGQLIYADGKKVAGGGHPYPAVEKLPNAHTRVVIHFADGSKLYFNDQRIFGFVQVVDETGLKKVLANYGPEAVNLDWGDFRNAMKRRKTSLKAALLNQSLIAGLGNIYVDEVAHRAKVRPQRRVNSLTETELRRIFTAIPRVLREAIKHGGTTFSHFRDASGGKGNYVKKLRVHGRAGKRCKRLACRQAGALLKKTKVAQRGTVYCPQCQE